MAWLVKKQPATQETPVQFLGQEHPLEKGQATHPSIPGLPGGSDACNAGDLGLIPGLGTAPGRGHGNPFQCFCLENFIDREA